MHGDVDIGVVQTLFMELLKRLLTRTQETLLCCLSCDGNDVFPPKMLGYGDKYGIRVDYASITRVQASRNGARSIRSANETMHLGEHFILSSVTETCMKPDD